MLMFAIHILSVPTLMLRLASMCAETYAYIQRDRIVLQCMAVINSSEQVAMTAFIRSEMLILHVRVPR